MDDLYGRSRSAFQHTTALVCYTTQHPQPPRPHHRPRTWRWYSAWRSASVFHSSSSSSSSLSAAAAAVPTDGTRRKSSSLPVRLSILTTSRLATAQRSLRRLQPRHHLLRWLLPVHHQRSARSTSSGRQRNRKMTSFNPTKSRNMMPSTNRQIRVHEHSSAAFINDVIENCSMT